MPSETASNGISNATLARRASLLALLALLTLGIKSLIEWQAAKAGEPVRGTPQHLSSERAPA